MGEMADFINASMDYFGEEDSSRQEALKTCRYCGKKNLFWVTYPSKTIPMRQIWRLADGQGIHRCPVNPAKD